MSKSFTHHPSSFRDPSGFIFEKDGILYRQVNTVYSGHFDLFNSSGLYRRLVEKNLLIPHEIINENLTGDPDYYTTLKPEPLGFVSYPYEWSFDMLKDAALLTLRITREGINSGMILKDATPYNIQWHKGKLTFIDSLSFEKHDETEPWIAYHQFCESFLAPLLIMHYSRNAMPSLLLAYPDGIPLNIASKLLPWRTRLSLHIYLHVHLHAGMAKKKAAAKKTKAKFSKQKLNNLLTSLELLIRKLKAPAQPTTWSAYYEEAAQRRDYLENKRNLIQQWLIRMDQVKTVADLGANNGEFSRIFASRNIPTIAADLDPYCINSLYNEIKKRSETSLQPLVIDLANPSPAIGANNQERASFTSRVRADLILALALIHHLAIGRNIPFARIVSFFRPLGKHLIIEFVPKSDEKLQLMLSGKKDIYTEYSQPEFENAFKEHYSIINKETITGSDRILYLMTRNEQQVSTYN